MYGAVVRNTYPHDPSSFTQGLYFESRGQTLLESTGLYAQSTVRRVELQNGRLLQCESLPDSWFGEGVTVQGGRCIQLLWREEKLCKTAKGATARETGMGGGGGARFARGPHLGHLASAMGPGTL